MCFKNCTDFSTIAWEKTCINCLYGFNFFVPRQNFLLSRASLALSFGRNGSLYSKNGRGLFGITPLMWTNAGNAATFLGLSDLIRDHFCFDIVSSKFEDMDIPIKAGIVLALLLEVILAC